MSRLLPCPFCGKNSQIVEHVEGTILHPAFFIRCDYCGAQSGCSDRDHVSRWNNRAMTDRNAATAIDHVAMPEPFRLEWSEPAPPGPACCYDHVVAASPLGEFRIEWKGWKEYDTPCVYLDGEFFDTPAASTLDAAKAVAQDHVDAIARALNPGRTTGETE